MKLKFLLLFILLSNIFLFNIYSLEGLISPSKESGVFNNDIEISFKDSSEIDLYYYFEESLDKTPIKFLYPLSLTSMYGESRIYNLVVIAQDGAEILETIKYQYVIDKDIPIQPALNSSDGIYNEALNVNFLEKDDFIYYSKQSNNSSTYKLWEGEKINIPQKQNLNTVFIKSYTEDSAGNRSSVVVNNFTILPLQKEVSSIDLISPAEGSFLNSQLLYIDMTGFKWIRYSFNDMDPAIRGTTYISPVLLTTIGNYKLKIAASPLGSDKIIRKELNFSIIDNKNIILNNESGVYVEDLNLRFNKGSFYYNLDDRKVIPGDSLIPNFLSIMPVPGVVKFRTIRIGDLSGAGEYRYLFVLDKKIPAAPIISISSNLPSTLRTEVRILSTSGSDIYFTVDGSTPDRYSTYYKKPFYMEIPDGLSSGSLIIKAIAYFNDKSTSLVTSKLLSFDIKKPEKPILTIISTNRRKTEFKVSNVSSNRIIYTVKYDGTLPETPTINSFTGTSDMILTVPHGIDEIVNINVALIDRAGNISEPVIINLMNSDTVPPREPEIIYTEGKVSISGTEKIFYKVINKNQINTNDFQLYETPFLLELDENIYNNYSISSYSVDEYGNKSKISIFNDIKIDNRIPVFPDYSGINNGEIYNQPRSLRFHSSDNIRVYYSISQGISTPADPVPSLENLVNDFIYFECPVNESRFYTVKLVAAYGEEQIFSAPELLSFHIDRIAPRAPVITSITNEKKYNEDLKISINDNEETVWILIKEEILEEDLNYANFEMNGILLNTDYMLIQTENTEKKYQISALSIDNAGNTSISRDIITFYIDKIQPLPPVIKEEYSPDNELFIRMISKDNDDIYYNISLDGSYPADPDINSSFYMLPIGILKQNNNPVYINARTIDSAGNMSKTSILHKISFTNNNTAIPVISVSKINSTISNLSFATLTGSKIFIKQGDSDFTEYIKPIQIDLRQEDYTDIFYYSVNNLGNKSSVAVYRLEKISSSGNIITGIDNNKIYNNGRVVWKSNQSRTVRYEVAIDNEEPSNVTVFSPELTDPIVFDSAVGETLNISINVKEFSETFPLLEKYDTNFKFTIDKTKPSIPIVKGVNPDGYYQDNRIIEFVSNDTVFYKISSQEDDLNSLDYLQYRNQISVSASEGEYKNYKIEFFSKDSAGNTSPVKLFYFIIDKANIYVSIQGKDSNNGSRIKPFKTLDRALEYSKQTERKVINLTEGEFLIDSILNLENDISVIGGYILGEWSEGRGETVLSISKRFPAISPMLNIYNGNIQIQNITISNNNVNGPMFQMTGGKLILDTVYLKHVNSNTPVTFNLTNSDILINNSKLDFGSMEKGNLFELKNSNISIDNSIIEGNGISGSLIVFNLEKTTAVLKNSSIFPSIAQKIEIVNSVNSDFEIENTKINSGFGTISSNLFILDNTNFLMKNSNIKSNTSSRILSCFDITDSTVSLDNNIYNLLADSGISFIRIVDSTIELSNSEINSNTTQEFIYLLNGKTSIINFEKNLFNTKSTDILNGFILNNSVSIFNNNIFNFEGGTTVFTAFNFISPLSIDISSNKIFSKNISWISSENQAAFTIKGGKDSISIDDNNIFGWKSILNINGSYIKTVGELNNYRGFLDVPGGNYSKED